MRRELLFKTTALFGPPHLKRNFNRDKLYIILLDLYVIRFFIFNIRRKNLRCVSINAIENYLNLFRELHAKCNRKYISMLDLINDWITRNKNYDNLWSMQKKNPIYLDACLILFQNQHLILIRLILHTFLTPLLIYVISLYF